MQYTAMRLSPEDRAYLDERYGVNKKKRWPVYVVAVVIAGLGAWVVWAFWAEINPKVTSGMTTYVLNDPHFKNKLTSTVTFQVDRQSKSVAATCTVQALAKDHSVVGQLTNQAIPLASPTTATFTWDIPTLRPAYAINWVGCTAPGQNAPK